MYLHNLSKAKQICLNKILNALSVFSLVPLCVNGYLSPSIKDVTCSYHSTFSKAVMSRCMVFDLSLCVTKTNEEASHQKLLI